MQHRKLGNLDVSAIGLGCMGMTHAFGAPSDEGEMIKLIHQAIDVGYTFFDTAECYTGKNPDGTTAYNEILVGKALKGRRSQVVLATKFGVRHTKLGLKMDSRPETIRKSVEGSLLKLDTDYIDLYYQHRLDPNVPVEEVAGVMTELIKEGKILHWGISEVDENNIRRAHKVCPITAIQNRYSMMYRYYDSLFPVLNELNIGYVAFSPLANGVLSDKFDKHSKFELGTDYRSFMPQFRAGAYKQNEELFNLLREKAKEKDATPAQIALSWMMQKHKNLVPIPGTRNFERLKENAESANIVFAENEIKAIDKSLNEMKMSGVFGGSKQQQKKENKLYNKEN